MIRVLALSSALLLAVSVAASASKQNAQWVLYQISVVKNQDRLDRLGLYPSMIDCFEAWSDVERTLPKPKVNVQIICVNTTETLTLTQN